MYLTAIVAMDRKGLIGANGKIPWNLPSDLHRFRRLTMGRLAIMGRKTWESLPGPLEGRTNIVMTCQSDYEAEGAYVVSSASVTEMLAFQENSEAFLIGGAETYSLFLRDCHRICLTVVDGDFEGDTYFPLHLLDDRSWWRRYGEMSGLHGKEPKHRFFEVLSSPPKYGEPEPFDIWNWVDREAYRRVTGL